TLLAQTPEVACQHPGDFAAIVYYVALECFNGSHFIMADSLLLNSPAAWIKFRIFIGR
ncbi:hypothetical protein EMCG_03866, partial [[Emmonsia] crescens]